MNPTGFDNSRLGLFPASTERIRLRRKTITLTRGARTTLKNASCRVKKSLLWEKNLYAGRKIFVQGNKKRFLQGKKLFAG